MGTGNKKKYIFLTLTAVMLVLAYLLFMDEIQNRLMIVFKGRGNTEYYRLSVSKGDDVWALGRRDDTYVFTSGAAGTFGWTGETAAENLGERTLIRDLYAVSSDRALLAVKAYGEDGVLSSWQIFLVRDRAQTLETVTVIPCSGGTAAEKESSVTMGSFSVSRGDILLPVWKDGQVSVYRIDAEASPAACSLQYTFACESMTDGLILEDGRAAIADENGKIRFYSDLGIPQYELKPDEKVTALYPASEGFYYMSQAGNSLNLIRESNEEFYLLQTKEVDGSLPLAVKKSGGILYIKDGRLYQDDGPVTDMSEMLYRPLWMNILFLVLVLVLAVFVSALITILVFRKRQRSFLYRVLAWTMVIFLIMILGANKILPGMIRSRLADIAVKSVEISAGLGLRFSGNGTEPTADARPTEQVWKALTDAGLFNSTVTLYSYSENGYLILESVDPAYPAGTVTEGTSLMLKAPSSGTVSEQKESLGGPVCSVVSTDGNLLLLIESNLSYVDKIEGGAGSRVFLYYMILTIIMFVEVLLVVFGVWRSVKRIRKGVYEIAAGDLDVEIDNPTGDELEELSGMINNLTAAIKKGSENQRRISDLYSRFLPNGLLSLMPGEGVETLNLESYAYQELLFVSADINFSVAKTDRKINEDDLREMDSILDHLSGIYAGFKAKSVEVNGDRLLLCFLKQDVENAYNAATAILEAADAFNLRMAEDGKTMTLEIRISMDQCLARVGIVGCEAEMRPVLFSACRHRLERLGEIAVRLDSRLLVTEKVSGVWEPEYRRLVGTAALEQEPEQIYESFRADPYLLARRKKETREEFESGMAAFYKKDFSGAKKIFISLIRQGSGQDGPVRFYLSMADRFEEKAPETMELNSPDFR